MAAVTFQATDPVLVGTFWGELLGRAILQDADGILVPGDRSQVGLRFVGETIEKPARNRLHIHLTSETLDDQRKIVETVLRLGGRRRGSRPLPVGRDIYLSDPDGSEICVIPPGNAYLAGCGFLGEVTCNGTRVAGLFWRDALEWALVWDQGEQIAIQSPEGGTKIGWDDWGETNDAGWNRQRFELSASDLATELKRLVALGATRIANLGDVVRMVDPDGSEFLVRTGPRPT
jgi:hypothetical protein